MGRAAAGPGRSRTRTSTGRTRPRRAERPGRWRRRTSTSPNGRGAGGFRAPVPNSRPMPAAQLTSTGLDALPPPEMARKAEEVGVAKAGMAAATRSRSPSSPAPSSPSARSSRPPSTAGGAALPYGVVRLPRRARVLARADPRRRRRRRALHRQQPDRDGVGKPARLDRSARCATGGSSTPATSSARSRPPRSSSRANSTSSASGAVGDQALAIAAAKTSLGFGQAIALGMLCNALVCLAVWLCYSARTTDRQDPRHRAADRRVRGRRLRAQRGEHVLHPATGCSSRRTRRSSPPSRTCPTSRT